MEIGFHEEENACTKMVVVGVGGGGCNSVNQMVASKVTGIEFIAVNTDRQALANSKATKKIIIGQNLTGGRGAGAIPDVGEKAALEDEAVIKEALKGVNLVFITAGMGGGTGTGAAPVIARIAKELGCLTIAVVTKPFDFESKVKGKIAQEGIKKLEAVSDAILTISNQALVDNSSPGLTLMDAWKMADNVLMQGVHGISEIILKSGQMNIDFSDVQTVMKSKGKILMGIGYGKGENAAIDAATMAIENPLLPELVVDQAKSILVNVTGSSNLSFSVYNEVMSFIQRIASNDALIITGQAFDDSFEDGKIQVTIIATGLEEAKKEDYSLEEETIEVAENHIIEEAKLEVELPKVSPTRADYHYSTKEFQQLLNEHSSSSFHEEPAFLRMRNNTMLNKTSGTHDYLSKKNSNL